MKLNIILELTDVDVTGLKKKKTFQDFQTFVVVCEMIKVHLYE